VDKQALDECSLTAGGLEYIYRDERGEDYIGLRRAFNALLSGIMAGEAYTRLPLLVRSVESIIRPSLENLADDFVSRCSVFTGGSQEAVTILSDIYRLGKVANHGYSLGTALGQYHEATHRKVIAERTFQAEVLASTLLGHLLKSPELPEQFKTSQNVDEFWSSAVRGEFSVGTEVNLAASAAQRSFSTSFGSPKG
jgi:hypothetical protein